MQQLKEAQNADLPSEQKLDQIQTLNTQAVNIQGMIAKVQSEQMKSAERACARRRAECAARWMRPHCGTAQ